MEKVLKQFNQKIFTLGIGVAITGILVFLLGLPIMMLRVRIAVVFLDARALFDMPFDQTDAVKVGMVMLVAIAIFLTGFAIFAGGTVVSLVEFSRKNNK